MIIYLHSNHFNRLPCQHSNLALLGSFVCQSELGDFDDMDPNKSYEDFKFSPNQDDNLLNKIKEMHQLHKLVY